MQYFFLKWPALRRMISLFLFCQGDLVAVGVLSGNRNFEGRIHPLTRANYLASPPLVIAYALAGTVDIDFEKDPLGKKTHWSLIWSCSSGFHPKRVWFTEGVKSSVQVSVNGRVVNSALVVQRIIRQHRNEYLDRIASISLRSLNKLPAWVSLLKWSAPAR